MNRHLVRLFPWLALVVASLLVYGRFLAGWLPVGADNSLVYAPFYALPWRGGPPLWDPYTLSGTSLLDNLQAALLYPLRWPFFFIPDWRTYFGVYQFLHYLVALWGAGVLLRRLGLRRGAVLAGALLYGISGHLAGRIINPTLFYACCWLPWLLAGAVGGGRRAAWLTTLGLVMILWDGSPHLMLYGPIGYALVFLFCTLWPAWRAGGEEGTRVAANRRRLTGHIAGRAWSIALALILAAPTLLPGVQRTRQSIRTEATVEVNLSDSVDWGELPLILLGGTGAEIYPEYIDKSLYVGVVVLALVGGLALRRASWRDPRFLAGLSLVLVGLFFALGRHVGLQHVMPWIPGFSRLAGPARALVLSLTGLSLLTALALDAWPPRALKRTGYVWLALGLAVLAGFVAMGTGVRAPQGRPPYMDDWLRAWAAAPDVTGFFRWGDHRPIPLFPLADSAMGLLAGGLILILTGARPRLRLGLLTGLIFLQLWHFYPRVAPPLERAGFFNPPPGVAWLQRFQAGHPGEPFRLAGYDALRLHDTEFYNRHKIAFLMPNLATLYGLEDIQGFDPLIRLDYLRLFRETTGRAPFNDPIRNLDMERPDPRLFDLLGLRFLVGHPYDRRLSTIPLGVGPGAPVAMVREWEERPAAGPITHWGFVSLLDGALNLDPGEPVAVLHVEAAEGAFDFTLRNGVETADVHAFNVPALRRAPAFRPTVNMEWWTHAALPRLGYRLHECNYRGLISFGRPLTVKHVFWRVLVPNVTFQVAAQSYRLARPVPGDDPWRLAFGTEEDVAPVFEYTRARPRAVLLATGAGEQGADQPAGSASSVDALNTLLDAPSRPGRVEWRERGVNGIALHVETPTPARLALREVWAPDWSAEVNGRSRPVAALGGLLRVVDLPAGASDVRLVYRPARSWWLLVVSLAVLAAQLVWEAWRWRRVRELSGAACETEEKDSRRYSHPVE